MRYTVYIKIIQRLQSWRNFLYQNEKRLSVSDNDLKVILFLWKARKEKFLNMSVYTLEALESLLTMPIQHI